MPQFRLADLLAITAVVASVLSYLQSGWGFVLVVTLPLASLVTGRPALAACLLVLAIGCLQ